MDHIFQLRNINVSYTEDNSYIIQYNRNLFNNNNNNNFELYYFFSNIKNTITYNNNSCYIKFDATRVLNLADYLLKNENFTYEIGEKMLLSLGNLLISLYENNLCIPFFNIEDILVIDDNFCFINFNKVIPIIDNKIKIMVPYKKSYFFSPEMKCKTSLPYFITYKSGIYSLGKLVMFCLFCSREKNREFENDENMLSILNPIYESRLYWCLKRCIEKNIDERFFLFI